MDSDQDRSRRRGLHFGTLHHRHQIEHGAARNELSAEDISLRIEAAPGYATVA
jgi:hypothetical protein